MSEGDRSDEKVSDEARDPRLMRRGLKALGPEVVQGLRFVCSDMWKPYLQVIAAQASQELHVLENAGRDLVS